MKHENLTLSKGKGLPKSLIPEQSVRSISSRYLQLDPRETRLPSLSKLQHSNLRHERSRQEFAIAIITESVRSLQHVKSITFRSTHLDTRCRMPVSVTLHFPSPTLVKNLQFLLMNSNIESLVRAPSILRTLRFFRSLSCSTKDVESSW